MKVGRGRVLHERCWTNRKHPTMRTWIPSRYRLHVAPEGLFGISIDAGLHIQSSHDKQPMHHDARMMPMERSSMAQDDSFGYTDEHKSNRFKQRTMI